MERKICSVHRSVKIDFDSFEIGFRHAIARNKQILRIVNPRICSNLIISP
jgi:hypothetical protein